ncbi:MAG: hypothetical protein ACLP51_20645 [Syntrophobacteraceae bacterium]
MRCGSNTEGQVHDARLEYALGSDEWDALALQLETLLEEFPGKDISESCGLTG